MSSGEKTGMHARGSQTAGLCVLSIYEWISCMNFAFSLTSSVNSFNVLLVPRSKDKSNELIIILG